MGRKIISITLIIMMMFTFTSCNSVKNDNATIQIWWYNYSYSGGYTKAIQNVLFQLEFYCKENGIPIEVVIYGEDTLAYEDYILKRNVAMANGNMITIEDADNMWDISKQHADYTKLENYENLLESFKDRFCIPLGVYYGAMDINLDAIKYYDINIDKSLITYDEYLEIKQKMKENSARFKMNLYEYSDIADYYIVKHGLKYVNETSEILSDNNKFKTALKNAIIGTCDDIILYNDSHLNLDDIYSPKLIKEYNI